MDENNVLDLSDEMEATKKTNQVLNVFCILGYVANGFWTLVLLVFLLMGSAFLNQYLPGFSQADENIVRIIYITLISMLLICVASIIGLIFAHQRKTAGVIVYGIANGIWAILMLLSGQSINIFLGLLAIAFIVVIAINHKK